MSRLLHCLGLGLGTLSLGLLALFAPMNEVEAYATEISLFGYGALFFGACYGICFLCLLAYPKGPTSDRIVAGQWSITLAMVGISVCAGGFYITQPLAKLAKSGVPTQGIVERVSTRDIRTRLWKTKTHYRIVRYRGGTTSLNGGGQKGQSVNLLVHPTDSSLVAEGQEGDGLLKLTYNRIGGFGILLLLGLGPGFLLLSMGFALKCVTGGGKPPKALQGTKSVKAQSRNDSPVQPLQKNRRNCSCGNSLEMDASFCSGCGAKVQPRSDSFCGGCGQERKKTTDKFCRSCGESF